VAAAQSIKRPPNFGPLGSVFFLPLLFLAAGLSIPYAVIAKRVARRREQQFIAAMQLRGRLIPWNDFVYQLDSGRGTLVVEHDGFKGPVRWWWTSDNLYDLCPYPLVDWLTMSADVSFRQASAWCHREYTNIDGGRALLVLASREEMRAIHSGSTFDDRVRWVEVPSARATGKGVSATK